MSNSYEWFLAVQLCIYYFQIDIDVAADKEQFTYQMLYQDQTVVKLSYTSRITIFFYAELTLTIKRQLGFVQNDIS